MNASPTYPSDIAFTPSVKALQEHAGSRHAYARLEQGRGFHTAIDDDGKPCNSTITGWAASPAAR